MVTFAILVVVLVYAGICAVAGFGPAGTFDDFTPEGSPATRRYHHPPRDVLAAYRAAAASTPGMRIVDERWDSFLIDLRPTSRIIGGNFGQVIRVVVAEEGQRGVVMTDWRKKVPFAIGNDHAAFAHAERALRMRAKAHGLAEVLSGVDDLDLAPSRGTIERSVGADRAPAAGWYPDPSGSPQYRYWDGRAWTDHLTAHPGH